MAAPLQAEGAIKIVNQISRNGKNYNLEIIYKEIEKQIIHFH